jgi:hypothetical protein
VLLHMLCFSCFAFQEQFLCLLSSQHFISSRWCQQQSVYFGKQQSVYPITYPWCGTLRKSSRSARMMACPEPGRRYTEQGGRYEQNNVLFRTRLS